MRLCVLSAGSILIGSNLAWCGSGDGSRVLSLSTQEVIWFTWKKYNLETIYHWNRYAINTKYNGEITSIDTSSTLRTTMNAWDGGTYRGFSAYAFRTYSINENTGQITLSESCSAQKSTKTSAAPKRDVYDAYIDDVSNCDQYRSSALCTTMWKLGTLSVNSSYGTATTCVKYKAKATQLQGAAQGEVTSTNQAEYPDNGVSGSYWYVRGDASEQAGTYIEDVKSTNGQLYPLNGSYNGYWYIRQ